MARKKSFEEEAADRGREAEGVARDDEPRAFKYDFSRVKLEVEAGRMVAREAATLPMRLDATTGEGYTALIDRVIGHLRHLLYSLDEQQQDIVRLRENTRVVLARLAVG